MGILARLFGKGAKPPRPYGPTPPGYPPSWQAPRLSVEPSPVADPRLTIEVVPQTCWFSNVRDQVTQQEWDAIRRPVYRRAQYRCEICGGAGPEHPVECHEVWHYDDQNHVQTLLRMLALCPNCHQVKHIGLSIKRGLYDQTLSHLARVNGWRLETCQQYVERSAEVWNERSRHQWQLNLDALREYGVEPPPPRQRKQYAAGEVPEGQVVYGLLDRLSQSGKPDDATAGPAAAEPTVEEIFGPLPGGADPDYSLLTAPQKQARGVEMLLMAQQVYGCEVQIVRDPLDPDRVQMVIVNPYKERDITQPGSIPIETSQVLHSLKHHLPKLGVRAAIGDTPRPPRPPENPAIYGTFRFPPRQTMEDPDRWNQAMSEITKAQIDHGARVVFEADPEDKQYTIVRVTRSDAGES